MVKAPSGQRVRRPRKARTDFRLALASAPPKLMARMSGCIKAMDADPSDARPHCLFGEMLAEAGDFEGAIDAFRQSVALDPKLGRAHSGLGKSMWECDDSDAALVQLKLAVTMDVDGGSYYWLGEALSGVGDMSGAIVAYRQALEIAPNRPAAHTSLGAALGKSGDWKGAEAALNRAIEIDPDFAVPHNHLGVVFGQKGDSKGAIESFSWAIELDPNYASAHSNLGAVLFETGELDGAAESLKRAVALDPQGENCLSARQTLARVLRAMQAKAGEEKAKVTTNLMLLEASAATKPKKQFRGSLD